MDAVFYLLDAMRLFRGKSLQEIQDITFEIDMHGQYGLNINDPQESYVLRALQRRMFSALRLICIMYAGFKRMESGMAIMTDAVHPLFALLEISSWISPESPPYRRRNTRSTSSIIFCRCVYKAGASSRTYLEIYIRVDAAYFTIKEAIVVSPRWSRAVG